jgi:hypothetical protein
MLGDREGGRLMRVSAYSLVHEDVDLSSVAGVVK